MRLIKLIVVAQSTHTVSLSAAAVVLVKTSRGYILDAELSDFASERLHHCYEYSVITQRWLRADVKRKQSQSKTSVR